jgi:hypothetical protein
MGGIGDTLDLAEICMQGVDFEWRRKDGQKGFPVG